MGRSASIIAVMVVVALGSACTTVVVPSEAELQGGNKAFLKGMESSSFSLGSTYDLRVKSVDGKSTWNNWSGYSDGLEVAAGQHHLVVFCSMVAEIGNIRTQPVDIELDVNLVSGHVYQLQPAGQAQGGGCGATIADVGEQQKTES